MKVTRRVAGKSVEQFNVGTMVVDDDQTDLIAALPEVARGFVVELTKQAGDLQVVSQQPSRFAGLEAYEVRAINTLTPPHDPNTKVRLNMRMVLVPDETKKRGVTVIYFHEENTSPDGWKVIADSFRLGKS